MSHRSIQREPLVASGAACEWLAWLHRLVTEARGRLAGAVALVVGALLLCAGALWVFAAIASEVAEGETTALDNEVLASLRHFASPPLDRIATIVTSLGSQVVWVLLVALLVSFGRQRRWGTVTALAVVTGGAQLLTTVLKAYFQRPRPAAVMTIIPAQAWSFPSGHATMGAAFYLFLAYVGWRLLQGRARIVWTSALIAVILLIDLTRLYLGVHYLTDVIAGNAVGAAWAAAVVGGGNLLALRRRNPARRVTAVPQQDAAT